MFRHLLIPMLALPTIATVFAVDPSSSMPLEAGPGDVTKPAPIPSVVPGIQIPGPRSRQEVKRVPASVKSMTDRERKQPFHLVRVWGTGDNKWNCPTLSRKIPV